MGRQRSQKAATTEAQVQKALKGIKDGTYKSVYDASMQLNLNESTVHYRHKGKTKSRVDAREAQQALSKAEEQALARWVTQITRSGYPARHPTVREMAEAIRMSRHSEANSDAANTNVNSYKSLEQQWVDRFLKRHPELKTVAGRTIDSSRVRESSPEKLKRWFDEFERVIDEYKVDAKNIYNMDETGFSIGTMQASHIIINKTIRTQLQAAPGRQEWVSIIECVSMDGTAIPPLTIFKGERLSNAWIPNNVEVTWMFSCNSKGWTSNVHGLEWLRKCFEPSTRERANNGQDWRILVCDGHESHVTSSFLAHCLQNRIHVTLLPPHTSHLLQPLDVGIFGPLKTALSRCLDPLFRTGIPLIQKVEWMERYIEARAKAFTKSNIEGGWRGAGLSPFYPQKVLRKVISTTPPRSTSPLLPESPSQLPFHQVTSSPPDPLILRSANVALNQLVSTAPFPTPAKTYIRRLTNAAEQFQAELAIQKKQYTDLHAVVTARSERKSAKRKSLEGQVLVTRMEFVEEFGKQEAARKERKKGKGTKRKRELTQEDDEHLSQRRSSRRVVK